MEAHDESSWYYQGKRAAIRAMLQKQGIRPEKVIDIGCGTGRNSVAFDPRDASSSYIGIEPAHLSFEPSGFGSSRLVRLAVETVFVEDTNGPADLVALIDVLEHLPEDLALNAVRRLLSPDGNLLITVPAYSFLWGKSDEDAGHLRRYTLKTLKATLNRHGFTVVSWNHYFFFAFFPLLVVSFFQRHFGRGQKGKGEGYFGPLPQNRLLRYYAEREGRLSRYLHWPWGTGIVAMARFSRVFKA